MVRYALQPKRFDTPNYLGPNQFRFKRFYCIMKCVTNQVFIPIYKLVSDIPVVFADLAVCLSSAAVKSHSPLSRAPLQHQPPPSFMMTNLSYPPTMSPKLFQGNGHLLNSHCFSDKIYCLQIIVTSNTYFFLQHSKVKRLIFS